MLTEYSGNLFGPVEMGHVFVIGGKTIDAANKFHLHLSSSKNKNADIYLGMTVKFRDDSISRYSRFNDEWSAEETIENVAQTINSNPIVSGDFFKIYILMGDDRFHIAINDIDYCFYMYKRRPYEINTISLMGDIQIVSQVDHRRIYPTLLPMLQFEDPKVVFSGDIPRFFTPGHVVVITGIPSGNKNGMFTLKFFEGPTKKQAFHFNVRFQHKIVVVNSMNDALEWRRDEERISKFPFIVDQQFKIAIGFTATAFVVAVDGQEYYKYLYRTENLLSVLSGFKISIENGMRVEVTSVDHLDTATLDCDGFERWCSYER